MRESVDDTLAALGADVRPRDAALVFLARQYADAIDAPPIDSDGVDMLARYGPKLTIVLTALHARVGSTAAQPAGRDELAEMRERRAGGA